MTTFDITDVRLFTRIVPLSPEPAHALLLKGVASVLSSSWVEAARKAQGWKFGTTKVASW